MLYVINRAGDRLRVVFPHFTSPVVVVAAAVVLLLLLGATFLLDLIISQQQQSRAAASAAGDPVLTFDWQLQQYVRVRVREYDECVRILLRYATLMLLCYLSPSPSCCHCLSLTRSIIWLLYDFFFCSFWLSLSLKHVFVCVCMRACVRVCFCFRAALSPVSRVASSFSFAHTQHTLICLVFVVIAVCALLLLLLPLPLGHSALVFEWIFQLASSSCL